MPNTQYKQWVIGLMAVYAVLCFVVPEGIKALGQTTGLLAWVIAAGPSYPLIGVLIVYIRRLAALDELQQKIELNSLAIATGLILIFGTAYGFVALHVPAPPFPLFLILPIFVLVWACVGAFLRRNYV